MIACPKCNSSNEDDSLVCRNCSTLLDGPRPLPPRTGRVQRVDPPAAADGAAEASGKRNGDGGADGATGSGGEPEATGEGGHLGDAFDLPEDDDEDDGDEDDGEGDDYGTRRFEAARPGPPPLATPRREPPKRRGAGAGEAALDTFHKSAIDHYRRGRPMISVIGFGSSGKTFLINRLRKELPDRGDWSSDKLFERRIPLTPEGLIDTVFTRNSAGGEQNGGERALSYAMIDCAGESFKLAVKRQEKDSEIAGQGARSYIAALALASAYVFVIEAPKAAEHDTADDEIDSALYGFRNILSGILVAKSRLESEEPEDLLTRGISKQELNGALDLKLRLAEPLVVAFAQADRLDRFDPSPTGYDHDPHLFARVHARALFHAVRSHFRHYRFAFVSAFAGFEKQPRGTPEPDYSLPSYGTAAVFDWLDRHLRPRPSLLGRFAGLAAGAPSAHAERLRRLVDRRFGRGGSPP